MQTKIKPILSVIPGNPMSTVEREILRHFDLSYTAYIKDENNIHIVKDCVLSILTY